MANILLPKHFNNGIILEPVSADPANPVVGQQQVSDGTARAAGLWTYNGATWESNTNTEFDGAVGDVVHSMLTEAQFQAERSTDWVLLDGRDITGSNLATLWGTTTLPDARGQFLRGKNNTRSDGDENPAGDLAIGAFQDDAFQGHFHDAKYRASYIQPGSGTSAVGSSLNSTLVVGDSVVGAITDGINGTPRTDEETRPKNITINIFVKIN